MTSSIGITIPRNNFLHQSIEDTMQLLIPAGIPQHLWKYHYQYFYQIPQYNETHVKAPHVLTWSELSFGFVLWFGSCGNRGVTRGGGVQPGFWPRAQTKKLKESHTKGRKKIF